MFTYTHISIILSIFLINRLLLNFVNYCSYPYGYFYMLCKSSILCLHLQGRRIMIPITIISGFLGAGKTTYLQGFFMFLNITSSAYHGGLYYIFYDICNTMQHEKYAILLHTVQFFKVLINSFILPDGF